MCVWCCVCVFVRVCVYVCACVYLCTYVFAGSYFDGQEDEKDLSVFSQIKTSAKTLTAYTSLLEKFACKINQDESGNQPAELEELLEQCKIMTTDMENIEQEIACWRKLHSNLKGPLKGIPIIKPLVEKFATAVRVATSGVSRHR